MSFIINNLLFRLHLAFTGIAILFLALGANLSTVKAQTFQPIPLDGGGWFSGFAQADNGRLYGYGDVFGAWRSDNGGTTWSYLNWGIPGGDIVGYGMAVQKDNADVVYYSTNNALWKSTNGGTSWTALLSDIGHNTPRYRGTSPILIRSDNPNEIWFAGPRKDITGWLWKSSDGGTTWAKAGGSNFDTNHARTLHNVSAYANQIWVGSNNGLYVSTDGGANFSLVGGSGRLNEVGMISRFTSGTFAGVGLVTRSNNNGGGISRITATDFTNAATYSVTDSATNSIHFGYPTGLQIFSDDSSSAWNTSGDRHGFSPAGNGGQLFTVRATTLNTAVVPIWTTAAKMASKNHPDFGTDQVIEAVGNPNKWMITGGGAPMFSLDKGLSWQYFPNGSGIAAVKTYPSNLSRYDANRVYINASDIGSAIVTDGGSSGQPTHSSHTSFTTLHSTFRILEGPDTQNLVLAGSNQGLNATLMLKSANGGINWSVFNLSGSGLPLSRDGVTKSVMSFNDSDDFLVVLASGTGQPGPITPGTINPGVWRSTNGGTTFTQVQDLPHASLNTGHRYDPQSCFIERDATAVNTRYFMSRENPFYRSTNGGTNWTTITHPFPNPSNGRYFWAWAFLADPIRGDNLWAAGDFAGVKVSRNGGQTWTSTAQHFNARFVSSCDGKIAIFGQAAGDAQPRLYYSSNDGATFTALTDATNNFHGVQGITVDRNGRVWVSWNSITVVTPPGLAPSAPIISPGQSASGVRDAAFAYTLLASQSPTSWAQITGTLPAGVTLDTSTGVLSGTPTNTGTFTPSFTATNATGTSPAIAATLTIAAPAVPSITSALTQNGQAGIALSYTITATNTPTSFNATNLPAGLNINTATGVISGTPTSAGTVNTSISATNAGGTASATLVFNLAVTYTVSGAITFSGSPLAGVEVGSSLGALATTAADGSYSLLLPAGAYTLTPSRTGYSFTPANRSGTLAGNLTGQNFTAALLTSTYEPFAYAAGVGALAAKTGGTLWGDAWDSGANDINATGLTYASSGTLLTSGGRADIKNNVSSFRSLPSTASAGTHWLAFIARSSNPGTHWGGLSLFEDTNERLFIGQRFNQSTWGLERADSGLGVNGGTSNGSAQLIVVKIVLKAGADDVYLWVNPSLASTPADGSATQMLATADFSFNRLRLAHGLGSGQILQIDELRLGASFAEVTPVLPPTPAISSSLAQSGTVGTALSYTITATNGPTSYNATSLPAGLSVNPATGVISGTPTTAGTLNATISATNAGGTGSATLVFTLAPQAALASFRSAQGLAANGSQDLLTPANDGVANLLKYAFNLLGPSLGQAPNLTTPNAAVLTPGGIAGLPFVGISTGLDAGKLQITYIRRKATSAPGITYTIQFSDTLGADSWSVNPSATESATSLDITFERVLVTDSIDAPARRFARVQVVATP